MATNRRSADIHGTTHNTISGPINRGCLALTNSRCCSMALNLIGSFSDNHNM